MIQNMVLWEVLAGPTLDSADARDLFIKEALGRATLSSPPQGLLVR